MKTSTSTLKLKSLQKKQIMSAAASILVGSAAVLAAFVNLPVLFAVWTAVGLITLGFGATIVIGAVVAPMRGPIALRTARARVASAPITRPLRVAA